MLQKNAVDAKAREIIFFPQPEVDIAGHDSLTPSARPLACFSRPLSRAENGIGGTGVLAKLH